MGRRGAPVARSVRVREQRCDREVLPYGGQHHFMVVLHVHERKHLRDLRDLFYRAKPCRFHVCVVRTLSDGQAITLESTADVAHITTC